MRLPGPKSAEMIAELRCYVVADPYPFVLDLPRCDGMWLATVDGDRLFDWMGYFGAKLIGHNHPGLAEPDYLRRLAVAANNKTANPDFLTPECLAYYRELHALAPVCMRNPDLEVYTVNSGAEAVENMMKYFINLHAQKLRDAGKTNARRRFLYFDQAFHGRTVFALHVTRLDHDPVVTKDFHGIVEGNIQIPFPAWDSSEPDAVNEARTRDSLELVEAALRRFAGEVIGIVVEPIQGAGGHRTASPEFFRGLSELARTYDVSLGFDEVQTAGGQTGTFFAIDQFDLPHPPHAVASGKKLGCGVVYMNHPMLDRNVLDSTWGGTLADMVRFVREMQIVRAERLIELVPEKAARLRGVLDALVKRYSDLVFNVRGMGLYQGFSLRRPEDKARLVAAAREQEGLLLLGAGTNAIRLRPNLSVMAQEIDLLGEMLGRALEGLRLEA
ncbi:MAG: aminotransferase class III-fold pyridoxal phosphate-dependent enzyme [Deltaproteobacteria bacterium]|nr:aminotransferase class III-fold pyridoxal phosphate-dependent enzyme [Deltaproteobacteria bacterium]